LHPLSCHATCLSLLLLLLLVRFHPPETFAPFTLSPGLCYNNALENGASAMEVSAVAAMNCALLLQQQLAQPATADHDGHEVNVDSSKLEGTSARAEIAVS
jgi:prenylcysteine oxidase/farnesylcysteine lyase